LDINVNMDMDMDNMITYTHINSTVTAKIINDCPTNGVTGIIIDE